MKKSAAGRQPTSNALQRWCLKALHHSCETMMQHGQRSPTTQHPSGYARHQGQPPIEFSCTAPHCHEWMAAGESGGYCDYCRRLSSEKNVHRWHG